VAPFNPPPPPPDTHTHASYPSPTHLIPATVAPTIVCACARARDASAQMTVIVRSVEWALRLDGQLWSLAGAVRSGWSSGGDATSWVTTPPRLQAQVAIASDARWPAGPVALMWGGA
jgi:hypothetical protein